MALRPISGAEPNVSVLGGAGCQLVAYIWWAAWWFATMVGGMVVNERVVSDLLGATHGGTNRENLF